MNLDKEALPLQRKIQDQDETINKLKNEEKKLNDHIQQFQDSMKKKIEGDAEA